MSKTYSQKKETILSGSTTTGDLTLGNYIGAIQHWTTLQEEYDCLYFLADLHALTVRQDPAQLRERTYSFFAQYLALGLDPDKNILFVQSHVHEHSELAWVLSCLNPIGHLNRMTQFKEKSQKSIRNINAGLFTYPVLMAADILLYKAHKVPVGEDQQQHLELCRNIVTFFENRYGPGTFVMPKPLMKKVGARIMSLQDPFKKMSKSDENEKNFISVIEAPEKIRKKIKRAVTDSEREISYDPKNKAGLANLLTIYSALSQRETKAICSEYVGKSYGHFKEDLADLVVETLNPVREKYEEFMRNRDYLREQMKKGAVRAQARAQQTLREVYDKIGLCLY